MSQIYSLPNRSDVGDLFSMLVGRPVTVADALPEHVSDLRTAGLFSDREGNVRGLCLLDLSLACYVGAALSLIPANMAKESVAAGTPSQTIHENLHEVFNVCVGFFNSGDVPHICFDRMALDAESVAQEVREMSAPSNQRLDASVSIGGYGEGCITVLSA